MPRARFVQRRRRGLVEARLRWPAIPVPIAEEIDHTRRVTDREERRDETLCHVAVFAHVLVRARDRAELDAPLWLSSSGARVDQSGDGLGLDSVGQALGESVACFGAHAGGLACEV